MSKIALDLKKFKHLKSDDKTTTLQHQDGHILTVAHNKLKPEMKTQLEALSKIASQTATSKEADEMKHKGVMMAEGGEMPSEDTEKANLLKDIDLNAIKELANKPNLSDKLDTDEPKSTTAALADNRPLPFSEESISKGLENLGTVQKPDTGLMSMVNPQMPSPQIPPQLPQAPKPQVTTSRQPSQMTMTPEEMAIQQAAQSQLPMAQPDPITAGMNDTQSIMAKGYENMLSGLQHEAQAQGDLGKAQAQMLQNQVNAENEIKKHYAAAYTDLESERQNFMHDIQEGYISPEKYWTGDAQGNGSHSRIATAIGMIIAGFNPTNRPNAAIEMLNKQMEMNLQAQRENLNAKNNLLSANLRQFGNLKDATDMTRVMQADMIHNQLLQAAATAQTPIAKAQAEKAAGELQMKYAPLAQQLTVRRAMMGLATSGSSQAQERAMDYMDAMEPGSAKPYRERYVPSVGMAKVPVPQPVRDELVSHQKLDTAAKELQSFIKSHGGLLNRMTPDDRAKAAALALPVQAAFREGTLGTVYREGEQPLLDKAVKGQPLDVVSYFINTEPTKLQTMLKTNEQQANILKRNYGFPVSESSSEPQYKTVNGVKYMRGPNGEAIKVGK